MNNAKTVMNEMDEAGEEGPQLQVVAAKKSATKPGGLSAPLVLPSSIHQQRPRPELAVLGWSARAGRLAGRN